MLIWIPIFAVLGLVVAQAAVFATSPGTAAQRFAAMWGASMTKAVDAWGMIVAFAISGGDLLLQFSAEPAFQTWAQAMKTLVPPEYRVTVDLAIGFVVWLARNRTAPK